MLIGGNVDKYINIKKIIRLQSQFAYPRLKRSMMYAIVTVYRVYFIFASLIIGLAFGMNILLTWFIDWLQSMSETPENCTELQRLVVYLAVLGRSYLLIRLISDVVRSAAYLIEDMLGEGNFERYRCCLTGKAALIMLSAHKCSDGTAAPLGEESNDSIDHNNAREVRPVFSSRISVVAEEHERRKEALWKLQFEMSDNTPCRWWLDLILQCIMHLTLDVTPPMLVLIEYYETGTREQLLQHFSLYACAAASAHILVFHISWTLNDYCAKWWAWRRLCSVGRARSRVSRLSDERNEDVVAENDSLCDHISVTVVSATGLQATDWNGKSDPYCRCKVLGEPGGQFETDVKACELNPVWNFRQLMAEGVRGRTLEFEVWDADISSRDDLLGKASLALSPEVCDVCEKVEVDLELSGHSKAKGSLKVQLQGLRVVAGQAEDAATLEGLEAAQGTTSNRLDVRDVRERASSSTSDVKGTTSNRLDVRDVRERVSSSTSDVKSTTPPMTSIELQTIDSQAGSVVPSMQQPLTLEPPQLRERPPQVRPSARSSVSEVVGSSLWHRPSSATSSLTSTKDDTIPEPANLCQILCALLRLTSVWLMLTPVVAVIVLVETVRHPGFMAGIAVPAFFLAWTFYGKKTSSVAMAKVADIAQRKRLDLSQQTPACPSIRRHLRTWLPLLQEWGEIHCGITEVALAPQLEVFMVATVLHAILFYWLEWNTAQIYTAIMLSFTFLRRLSLTALDALQVGWLVGLLEGVGFVIAAASLNLKAAEIIRTNGNRFLQVTLILAVMVQFTFARYQTFQWRTFVACNFALQFGLFMIICVCMMTDDMRGSLSAPAIANNMSSMPRHNHSHVSPKMRKAILGGQSKRATIPHYDWCGMKFELPREEDKEPGHLTILDFAHIAALTNYEPKDFEGHLHEQFPGWSMARACKRCMKQSNNDWTTFYEIWDPQNTTTVFAVRGTQDPLDLLQDMNIWLSIGIAQVAGLIGPDLRIAASHAALILSNGIGMEWFTKDFYGGFLEYVRNQTLNDDPNRTYYFTGHSLGGGLAALVALEMKRVAVTFSAPGLKQVSKMMLSERLSSHEVAVNSDRLLYTVIPENDFVPMIDERLGSSLRIGCNKTSPFQCHKLTETIWEMQCAGCKEHSASGVHVGELSSCPSE